MSLCLRLGVVRLGLGGKQIYSLSCLLEHFAWIVCRPAQEETEVMADRCYGFSLFTVSWLQIAALTSMQMWNKNL